VSPSGPEFASETGEPSAPPSSNGRKPGNRLTVEDWIEAGFGLIAEEGLRAAKIDRLCERLGVTKGSFYWHFSDIRSYLDALVSAWAEAAAVQRTALTALRRLPPAERLRAMTEHLSSPRQWTLERAIREWARYDAGVAAQVGSSDVFVFGEVSRVFGDNGYEPDEAGMRARAAFAAGIGLIHLSPKPPSAAGARERERFLEFMLRP
jgi:AcrR family transcriptional regulator